ncbi:MAG: tetratricopeptide repeat protein [Proteobacteria bacterium]|nr:tetratricopeptide repeat protein [Pseudomonadota bacterium]
MSSWLLFLRFIVLVLALCSPVRGETGAAQADLYLDAMRSLSEGRQYDANEALMRMIEQEPQHAGAWLDLAIIQCQLGHAAEAEKLFSTIESRFSPPPGILEVIASSRAGGCKGWQPRTQLSVMLGRGSDSNVNQGASSPGFSIGSGSTRIDLELLPEYLPQRDQYLFVSADYRRDLTANGSLGFLQLRTRQNDSLKRYDTTSLLAGLEQPWRFGQWGVRGSGALGMLSLGRQLYQRQAQIQARISPPEILPARFQFSLLTSLSHFQYPTLANYDSNTAELSGLLTYQGDRARAQASFGLLSDRRAAAHLGGNRHGQFASLMGNARLADKLQGELGWTRQRWISQSAYAPGLIDESRRQDTQLLRAALMLPLEAHHSLQFEWRQVRNDENISLFKYDSQLVQVSWLWQGL